MDYTGLRSRRASWSAPDWITTSAIAILPHFSVVAGVANRVIRVSRYTNPGYVGRTALRWHSKPLAASFRELAEALAFSRGQAIRRRRFAALARQVRVGLTSAGILCIDPSRTTE